jgi:hypothetical protein
VHQSWQYERTQGLLVSTVAVFQPPDQLTNGAFSQALVACIAINVLEEPGERAEYGATSGTIEWIHLPFNGFAFTLKQFIAVALADIFAPLVAHGCRLVQVNGVGAGRTRSRLQVDYHAGVGGEGSPTSQAPNIAGQVDHLVLESCQQMNFWSLAMRRRKTHMLQVTR